jgi:hypothetical protein
MLDSLSATSATSANPDPDPDIDSIDAAVDGAGPGPDVSDIKSPIVSTGADGVRGIHYANSISIQLTPLNTAAWLTNLERTDIKWLVANNRFPRPLYIYGRNNRRVMCFVRGEVEQWILERIRERDAAVAAAVSTVMRSAA